MVVGETIVTNSVELTVGLIVLESLFGLLVDVIFEMFVTNSLNVRGAFDSVEL